MINKALINALCTIGMFLLVIGCIQLDILYFHNNMGEESVTETMQLIMLGITIYSFIKVGKVKPELRHAAFLIAAFYTVLFIRENDGALDYIYHGAWEVPALLVTAIGIRLAYKGGKNTIEQMATILKTKHMNGVITSTLMLLVFSRLYGMKELWSSLTSESYARVIKNISEESIELLCYSLIVYSTI
ncbi:hypothetical protein F9817_23695, partial [Vibrio sp. CAIM 722]